MDPAERFEDLLRTQIAPTLESHGFRRRRNSFHRRVGENWLIVDFQKSAKTTAEQIVFTINLGVASAALIRFQGRDPADVPEEYDCQLRERLGMLLADPGDRWWIIDRENESIERLGATLQEQLATAAIPFLLTRSTDEQLRDHLMAARSGDDWRDLAVLLKLYGPREQLESLMENMKRRYKFNRVKQHAIQDFERRLNDLVRPH